MTTPTKPAPGQIWRDRDKRMSSGNRHVRLVALREDGRWEAVASYEQEPGKWVADGQRPTRISPKNLGPKWELVQP